MIKLNLSRLQLNKNQHAFTGKRSTVTAIANISQNWFNVTDNSNRAKEGVHALFIDFRNAFDLVDHGILLRKLAAMNVWIPSFLDDRNQQVKLAGTLSSIKPCPEGVTQTAVISPVLFNIHINENEMRARSRADYVWAQYREQTVGSLESEPLKFVSPRMSHYACSLCWFWPANCIFWPIKTLNWLFRHYSGQSIA